MNYLKSIIRNSKLADELKKCGFNLVSGGTDNHLILIDLQNFNVTGRDFEKQLDEVHITVNKNSVPNDPQSPFVTSGVRLGTPAVTTRGFKEPEMAKIANWISLAVNDFDAQKVKISEEVQALCAQFPIY